MSLSNFITVSERLAKSANVERDSDKVSFENYIVTGRVQDVLRQFLRGMQSPKAGRAFSITGPYGTGKSSFAIFLNALFSSTSSDQYMQAIAHLASVDKELAEGWERAREQLSPVRAVPLRSFGTAEREPLVWTISKALVRDASEEEILAAGLQVADLAKPNSGKVDASSLKTLILSIAEKRPVVLLIDEFGKNLQTFGSSGAAGDPYLLQELAEASQGLAALPIFIITMQHLAFDEYVSDLGNLQRREWSKIQGRFHDVGFVESSEQTHFLIASAFDRKRSSHETLIEAWYSDNRHWIRELVDPDLAQAAYPLHPLAVAALPELCNRYGQNERTLFSFLAGDEPRSLKSLLSELDIEGGTLPFVGMNDVYEYFLGAAASFIAASSSASRWLEIELKLRDYKGQLPILEEKLLKSIAVLNLVSAGGALRASKDNLLSLASSSYGTIGEIEASLTHLAKESIVTYRDFADEWRIWKGSDFDVRSSIEAAKARSQALSTFELMSDLFEPRSSIAGRSSQDSGILRVFGQQIASPVIDGSIFEGLTNSPDGVLLYQVVSEWTLGTFEASHIPVVVAEALSPDVLRQAAIEVYATASALAEAKRNADEVAFNELNERLAIAKLKFQLEIGNQWHPQKSRWTLVQNGTKSTLPNEKSVSEILSKVVDRVYSQAPFVANEMIARRELTSQGAMARRVLAERLIASSEEPDLDMDGYGPEVAIYKAIFEKTGIHSARQQDNFGLGAPSDSTWVPIWEAMSRVGKGSASSRTNLSAFDNALSAAPFGLKSGLIWLLVIAYLQANREDLALYEYGSLVLSLDDAVAERLLKNPGVFSIRHTGVTGGARRQILSRIGEAWGMPGGKEVKFMTFVRQLSRQFSDLPPYVYSARLGLSHQTQSVIAALKDVAEPDELVFTAIPDALGLPRVGVEIPSLDDQVVVAYVNGLAKAIQEARSLYSTLLSNIEKEISASFGVVGAIDEMRAMLSAESEGLPLVTLNSNLRALASAFMRKHITDTEWVANIAMIATDGLPPRQWSDDSFKLFKATILDWSRAWMGVVAISKNAGEASRAVTISRPDGTSETRVVDLDHSLTKDAIRKTEQLLEALVNSGIPRSLAAAAIAAAALNVNVDGSSDNLGDKEESDV